MRRNGPRWWVVGFPASQVSPYSHQNPPLERYQRKNRLLFSRRLRRLKQGLSKEMMIHLPKTNMAGWRLTIFHKKYIFIHGCFSMVICSFSVVYLEEGSENLESNSNKSCFFVSVAFGGTLIHQTGKNRGHIDIFI